MKDGFSEYESHIDKLITQYKSQLEQIKITRENKDSCLRKGNIKNNLIQESSSYQNENFSTNKIAKNTFEINPNEIIKNSDSNLNALRINTRDEFKPTLNNKYEDKEKKLETFFRKDDSIQSKLYTAQYNDIDNNELSRKIGILNEENFRLNRKINELSKQNEKLDDVLIRNQRLQDEINNLNESESKIKKEFIEFKTKYENLEKKSQKFSEIELRYNEENSKIKYKLKETEKFYEDEMKYKDEQISSLKNETICKYEDEVMSYRIVIEKINLFLKNILENIIDNNNKNSDIFNDKLFFKNIDYDSYFKSIENYIQKLRYDNTELVKYINTRLNRASKEEMISSDSTVKIQKLNEINNDLKIENSLLKNQINKIIDGQSSTRDLSRTKTKTIDNLSYNNYQLNKRVDKESLDKCSNSYNTSRATTPLKIKTKKNKEDSRSNNDSEVSFNKDNKTNKSRISEFSRKERFYETENRNDNLRKRNNPYSMTPLNRKHEDRESIGPKSSFHIDLERKINNNNLEGSKLYPKEIDDLINMKSPKSIKAGEFTLSKDLNQLEGLKHRIKDLENKLVEINTDDKEKQIIDSIREYRNKNISSPENKKYY